MTRGARFPRAIRLRKRPDFVRVQSSGSRLKSRDMVACWSDSVGQSPRIGITVSRRVGNAVIRNRVKRWLRESVRQYDQTLPPVDVVFISRPSAQRAGFTRLKDQVEHALNTISRRVEC